MQSYLSKRSRERGSSGGEFCEVISTLTHDLTKARNQLVRLMHQVSPGGARRLYGGYSVPQKPFRPNTTPCVGSNAHIRHQTPAAGNLGWSNYAHPSAPVPPQRPCRSMTVPGANQQPLQRALCRPQQKVPNCWDRPHREVGHPCERQQQQCKGSDTSGTSYLSERRGQRDSTCVNITFDSPDPAPVVRRPHRCRRYINTSRGSKSSCLQSSRDPARLQGGGSCKRHNCVGTRFAALLEDVTSQLRESRLAADHVKTT